MGFSLSEVSVSSYLDTSNPCISVDLHALGTNTSRFGAQPKRPFPPYYWSSVGECHTASCADFVLDVARAKRDLGERLSRIVLPISKGGGEIGSE
jgi:hypothetical protein